MFKAQNPAVIDSWDQSMSEMQSNLMKEKYFGAINQLKRKKKDCQETWENKLTKLTCAPPKSLP